MKQNKIIKNASWIVGGKIVQSLLGFIISILTARYLGPSNFGLINYAASIVAFVAPIMYLGFNSILVQELIKNPKKEGEILGTSIVLSVSSALMCIVGITAFTSVVNMGETDTIIVSTLYSLLLLFQALDLVQYWFQAKYLSKYTSLTMLSAYLIVAVYRIYLLASQKSIYWFAVTQSVDYFLIALSLLIIYKKLGGSRLQFSWKIAKDLFRSSRYYIISSMMVTVFAQTAQIMLKLMIDDAATGYYSAAVRCASITGFVFTAIIDSGRPAILESHMKNRIAFEKNISRLYSIIIYLSIAQSIAMTVLAKPIILILYGEEYSATIAVLRVLVWYTTFSYIGGIRDIWILAEGKQRFLWMINLSGAVFNIVCNLIFIPLWGVLGAAFVSLITQLFTNVLVSCAIKPISYNNVLIIRAFDIRLLTEMFRKVIKR